MVIAAMSVSVPLAASAGDPGTIPVGGVVTNNDPLNVMVTESGRIFLSTDGSGTNNSAGADIRAEKPSAGATVRSAFLFAASTGFSGHAMVDTDVSLAGTFVHWSSVVPSDISSSNGWGNVTSIVKPTLDAAPVGITSFHVVEANTGQIDGEGLAVIWNDPAQTKDNTIALLFGAQNTAGDDFKVLYAQPIDKTDPSLLLQMSLGISFGFQQPFPSCTGQFSTIDVNGNRMSSSAGGQDDGESANGALITVGGIGDNNLLPLDPNSSCDPTGFRQDNELYNYGRFVTNGDTMTTIHTHNPSNDDNIFFAGFFLKSVSAVVGAGIVLSPQTATNDAVLGSTHTVTATVQDNNGNRVVGAQVTFTVTAGPNAGATGVCSANVNCTTDASGKVSFTYASNGNAGTDTIQACFTDATNTRHCATASKIWVSVADQAITAQGTTFSATEGLAFVGQKVASFCDPDPKSTAAEYSATINWGDSTGTSSGNIVPAGACSSGPGNSFNVTGNHTYTEENNSYTLAVTITDVDTPSNTQTVKSFARVSDAAIHATCAAAPVSTQSFSGTTARFTDDNSFATSADFSATIAWGDASSSPPPPVTISGGPGSGPYTVNGTHTYSSTGLFTITTTITDDGGATDTTSCKVFIGAFPTGNGATFVVGDLEATGPGAQLTWWSSQWAKINQMSGGPAPASMKGFSGFEDMPLPSPLPPLNALCGMTWTTDTGNATPPPQTVPDDMFVIVSSHITQNGSVISGDIKQLILVHNNPGYAPDPGHTGTGTEVILAC
jgi:hypothetical protein